MKDPASSRPIVAAVITMFVTYALVILASMVLPVVAPIASATLDIPAKYIGLYAALLYSGAAVSSMFAPNLIIRYGALRTSQGALIFAALSRRNGADWLRYLTAGNLKNVINT